MSKKLHIEGICVIWTSGGRFWPCLDGSVQTGQNSTNISQNRPERSPNHADLLDLWPFGRFCPVWTRVLSCFGQFQPVWPVLACLDQDFGRFWPVWTIKPETMMIRWDDQWSINSQTDELPRLYNIIMYDIIWIHCFCNEHSSIFNTLNSLHNTWLWRLDISDDSLARNNTGTIR